MGRKVAAVTKILF